MANSDSGQIFRRLIRLLRPYWGWIFLGAVLVIISAPCELFPAIVWRFVTDDLAELFQLHNELVSRKVDADTPLADHEDLGVLARSGCWASPGV